MERTRLMNTAGRMIGQQRLGMAAVFIATLLVLYHALTYAPNTILLDQWRFVYGTLAKYYSGTFSFLDLVTNETSHIRVGYRAVFLLNAILFDLNVHVEIVLGLIALLLFTLLLFRRYLESMAGFNAALGQQVLFLLIVMVIFSLNKNVFFIYSTAGLNTFLGWLLYLAFWTSMDSTLRRGEGRYWLLVQIVLLLLIVFGFSGDKSPAVLASALAIVILDLCLRPAERRPRLIFLAKLIGLALLFQAAYWVAIDLWAGKTFVKVGLPPFLTEPAGALKYVLYVLASGVVHRDFLLRPGDPLPLIAGAAVLASYGLAALLYFRSRLWRTTYLPLTFMIYSLLFIAELLQARYGREFGGPLRATYAAEPQLGMIGVLWIYAYVILEHRRNAAATARPLLLSLFLFLVLIPVEYINARHVLDGKAAYRMRSEKTIALVKRNPDAKFPIWYCRRGKDCNVALGILKAHKLNMFDE